MADQIEYEVIKLSPWLNNYRIELVCPHERYKIVKRYDSLLEMANELHTDIECPKCGKKFTVEEYLLFLSDIK